jgi:hypothetical protein
MLTPSTVIMVSWKFPKELSEITNVNHPNVTTNISEKGTPSS